LPIYSALRPLLFRCDPERAHGLGMAALRLSQSLPGAVALLAGHYRVAHPALRQTLFGCDFANPVGLAAGFDKNAEVVRALPGLGFGFAEVGTVTPLAQSGNPRPRLFRHAAQRSLQNALGFNNEGLAAIRLRLAAAARQGTAPEACRYPLPLGLNLGKGRATPPTAALGDYEALLRQLGDLADYLVVNLSSPNTPGLRDLQNESFLRDLMQIALAVTRTPVLVKLSPDLAPPAAADLAATAVEAGAAGIVATNTSTDYSLLPSARDTGGLSGQVLRQKSWQIFAAIASRLRGSGSVLISVGGIDSGAEAYRRLRAGASLVQLYTGLIYEGPSLPRRINRELLALLTRDGFTHLAQAIGVDPP
jgi:dihydroorotate dehydrogenase